MKIGGKTRPGGLYLAVIVAKNSNNWATNRWTARHMPPKKQEGFNARLRIAMTSRGLTTAEDLAAAIKVSIPTARVLLKTSTGYVDALTVFRISDRTGFSARWLVSGQGQSDCRIAADPDEKRLLEILRSQPVNTRDDLYDRILELIHTV